jgi:hypothetical protein
VAAVQYTFTHKQFTEYRERNIHNNKKKKIWKCGPCPIFASYTLAFALQLRKKDGKTSVRVVEKCPDILGNTFQDLLQLHETVGNTECHA